MSVVAFVKSRPRQIAFGILVLTITILTIIIALTGGKHVFSDLIHNISILGTQWRTYGLWYKSLDSLI
jgi:hypothetical protein